MIGKSTVRLTDGSTVTLIDSMGSDQRVVDAARTSYGGGAGDGDGVAALLDYMRRHRHTSPFEMCEVVFLLEMPIDTARQHVRHRTASMNEYSTRYKEAIDQAAAVGDGVWRTQSKTNKQGSGRGEGVVDWPAGYVLVPCADGTASLWDTSEGPERSALICEHLPADITPGRYLSMRESDIQRDTRWTYEERLRFDVAREVARKDLPMSTFTRMYWKIDLHNFLHYAGLRCDPAAQLEIRELAGAMLNVVRELFPLCVAGWEEWENHGVRFGRTEMEVVRAMLRGGGGAFADAWAARYGTPASARAIKEFENKLWGD